MQLYDVLQNGYWHARGHEYLSTNAARLVEWLRLPGDLIFIFAGSRLCFGLLVACTGRLIGCKSLQLALPNGPYCARAFKP